MEIERKFLIEKLPDDLTQFPRQRLEQGYLCTNPVIRVRRDGGEYWLTCKGPGLLSREEYTIPLTAGAYDGLLAKTEGLVITKSRFRIPLGNHTAELDIFDPPLSPLVLAEVEFSTEEEALAFVPPAWFGREVTFDPAYSNSSLSMRKTGE